MFDKKEKLIITQLRSNARQKITDISRKTQIPVTTIYEKLKREAGIIQRYTSLIDFARLGYETRVNVILKVSKEDKPAMMEHLMKSQSINSLFRINNGFDFLLEAVFRNVKEVEDYFEGLEQRFKIQKKEIYYIVDDIKREAFMSDPQLLTP